MRIILASLLGLGALAAAQPAVTQVVNYGNASGGLAPGVFAIIIGSNLGGTGQTVTVGGQQANIVQSGSGQIAAVFPANVPVGKTTLTVAYNGQTSAPFPVTLAAYAPGIGQFNSGYFFPTCPCFGSILNSTPFGITASSPALPGTQVGSFVTGLGATPGTPLPVVMVGAQAATGVMVQQDGDFTQFYDVVFTVPDVGAGPQATTISVGGVSSPAQTLYVGSAPPSLMGIENSATGTVESSSHAAAANSIVSIYVSNAGTTTSIPSSYPTTSVEGVQILVNGTAIPIYSLVPSANLINVQFPSELGTSGTATVAVQTANGVSSNSTISLGPADVGVFRIPSSTYPNNAAVQIAGTVWDVMPASVAGFYGLPLCAGASTLTACGQPATPGQNIVIYWTGGGATSPSLPTGQVAPVNGSILYKTVETPTVTIGGINAVVSFSGIVPGSAGEYQLNVTIPASAPAGDQVPLVVAIGGSSDTVGLAIQAQ